MTNFISDIRRFFIDMERWVAHRTYDRYDIVKTGLTPDYWDTDSRMMHSNFSLLVDYVEIELASIQHYIDTGKVRKRKWFSRRMRFRSAPKEEKRLLGLQYLNWEIMNNEEYFPATQRKTAKEIKKLYLWWSDIRPRRADPYDRYKKELDALPPSHELLWDNKISMTQVQRDQFKDVYDKIDKLEEKYDIEDEKMLVRLIKIRKSLWT